MKITNVAAAIPPMNPLLSKTDNLLSLVSEIKPIIHSKIAK